MNVNSTIFPNELIKKLIETIPLIDSPSTSRVCKLWESYATLEIKSRFAEKSKDLEIRTQRIHEAKEGLNTITKRKTRSVLETTIDYFCYIISKIFFL